MQVNSRGRQPSATTMTTPSQKNDLGRHFVAMLALLIGLLGMTGCGGEEVAKLEDYLDELEFDTPLESVKEIEVGHFRIPSAAKFLDASGRESEPMWVQLKFKMYVVVADEHEKAVLASIERHRGMLNDAVLSVCREASIQQLDDNRWATIKANLLDSVRPLLGDERVRQVTLNRVSWEPI